MTNIGSIASVIILHTQYNQNIELPWSEKIVFKKHSGHYSPGTIYHAVIMEYVPHKPIHGVAEIFW